MARRTRQPAATALAAAFLLLSGALAAPESAPLTAAPAHAAKEPKRTSVYRTKGYKGIRTAPKTGPEQAPASVGLGAGEQPDVLVDAAGAAHVVFTEKGPAGGSDTTRYCRIPRGGTACDNPNGAPFTGPPATFSQDFAGPKILQIGDGLVVLSFRYPIVLDHPDGQTSDSTLYAWTSDDGGQSWSAPAIIGSIPPSGDATVLRGAQSRIAVVTDTVTGGTSVQIYPSGAYKRGGILVGPGNAAYNGAIADDGSGTPIAAFSDAVDTVFVRRWSGSGDVADPATWSTQSFPGTEPRLAGGPRGTQLLYRDGPPATTRPWSIRSVAGGQPGPVENLSGSAPADDEGDLVQSPNGTLRALWTGGISPERIFSRVAAPGQGFTAQEFVNLSPGDGGDIRAGMADDGGGVVAWKPSASEIRVSAFGSLAPTGALGAGARAGTGIPGAVAGCTGVTFGKVIARPRGGCLFPADDPQFQGAAVSEGEIDLGGLAIVPEANVKIVIDPRRQRLDTTGTVRVVLRGGGLPDLTIFKGELHVDFKATGSGVGAKILDFDPSGLDLGGFPITGRIQVFLTEEGVRMPISIKLPPALGGISGEATLLVRRGSGVTVESARISADVIPIGPLAIEGLDIRYSGSGSWSGAATLALPPRPGGMRLGAAVEFRDGRFVRGSLALTPLPFPGVPIATNVYASEFRGKFEVDPLSIGAGATIGAFPTAPPVYTVDVKGDLTATFDREVVFRLDASARVLTLGVARSQAIITTAGFGSITGEARLDLAAVSAGGTLDVAVDGPGGRFAGSLKGSIEVLGITTAGAEALVSNAGVGLCVEDVVEAGAFVASDGSVTTFGPGIDVCDLDAYRGPPIARPAQAGTATFSIPRGAGAASVEVTGTGGVPDVTLVSPSGARIVPVAPNAPGARSAAAVTAAVPGASSRSIGLRRPAAGSWRVEANAGSPAVAGARVALPARTVSVRGSVRGRGSSRVLTYRASGIASGTTVRVFERGRGISRPLGTLRNGAGTLRLRAGEGRGGTRSIVAFVERRAPVAKPRIAIARYVAPGAQRPASPRGARASLRRGVLSVRWRTVPGSAGYVVKAALRDGRVIVRTPRAAKLLVRGLGGEAALRSATVSARSRAGLTSTPARARS